MGQLDLNITEARRLIVKRALRPRMQNRLKNKESDHDKIRERDRLNGLLTNNIDTLFREERKSILNIEQVRRLDAAGSDAASYLS